MSVNQQAHTGPPYGQSQPGYANYMQPDYGGQQMQSIPASQYGAYNGPVTGYQQAGPPQGRRRGWSLAGGLGFFILLEEWSL